MPTTVIRTTVPAGFGKGAAYYGTHMNKIMKELKPTNAILQGGLVKPQGSPNMTVIIPDLLYAIGADLYEKVTGNSSALTAASTGKSKLAIIEIGADGTIDNTYGAEVDVGQPVPIPVTSANHAKICMVGPILDATTQITTGIINNTERDLIR